MASANGFFVSGLLATLHQRASLALVRKDGEAVTGLRYSAEPENLDRRRGSCLRNAVPPIVKKRADAAKHGASHHDVTHSQGPFLNEQGGRGASSRVESGLDDNSLRAAVRVGAQFQ